MCACVLLAQTANHFGKFLAIGDVAHGLAVMLNSASGVRTFLPVATTVLYNCMEVYNTIIIGTVACVHMHNDQCTS